MVEDQEEFKTQDTWVFIGTLAATANCKLENAKSAINMM